MHVGPRRRAAGDVRQRVHAQHADGDLVAEQRRLGRDALLRVRAEVGRARLDRLLDGGALLRVVREEAAVQLHHGHGEADLQVHVALDLAALDAVQRLVRQHEHGAVRLEHRRQRDLAVREHVEVRATLGDVQLDEQVLRRQEAEEDVVQRDLVGRREVEGRSEAGHDRRRDALVVEEVDDAEGGGALLEHALPPLHLAHPDLHNVLVRPDVGRQVGGDGRLLGALRVHAIRGRGRLQFRGHGLAAGAQRVEVLLDLRLEHGDALPVAAAQRLQVLHLRAEVLLVPRGRPRELLHLEVELAVDLRLRREHLLRPLHLPLQLQVAQLQLLQLAPQAGHRVLVEAVGLLEERHVARVLRAALHHGERRFELPRVHVERVEREAAPAVEDGQAGLGVAHAQLQGVELALCALLVRHEVVRLPLQLLQRAVVRLRGLAQVDELQLLLPLPLLRGLEAPHALLLLVRLRDEGRLAEPLDLFLEVSVGRLQLAHALHELGGLLGLLLRGLLVLTGLLQGAPQVAHLAVQLLQLVEGPALQLPLRPRLGLEVIEARLQQLVARVRLAHLALERQDLLRAAPGDARPGHRGGDHGLGPRVARLRAAGALQPRVLRAELVAQGLRVLQVRAEGGDHLAELRCAHPARAARGGRRRGRAGARRRRAPARQLLLPLCHFLRQLLVPRRELLVLAHQLPVSVVELRDELLILRVPGRRLPTGRGAAAARLQLILDLGQPRVHPARSGDARGAAQGSAWSRRGAGRGAGRAVRRNAPG